MKAPGLQIAVFRDAAGALRAIDNLCPHEGYPLVSGNVRDCVLTCAWHNFKFSLDDGSCLVGEEDVRVWPVREVDGVVEVDLAGPAPDAERARLLESLAAGLHEPDEIGRVVRDAVRLIEAGEAPVSILARAAAFDARHARYGSTHALPVAADIASWLPRYRGTDVVHPLAQALELAAQSGHRRPPRAVPAPEDPGSDLLAAERSLRERIEREDMAGAEALLRGALAAGATRRDVEPWLLGPTTDHFLGFGHGLIYAVKVFDLLDATGWEWAREILPATLFGIASDVREDTLPLHATLAATLAKIEPELPELYGAARSDAPFDRAAFLGAVLDGKKAQALTAVIDALRGGVAAERIASALVVAGAERWLRFDDALDADPTIAEGWLDVTHVFTFASAVRTALTRLRRPESLRWLLHAAAFVARTRGLDLDPASRIDDRAEDCDDVERILSAIRARDPRRAVALGLGWLRGEGDRVSPLRTALESLPLHDATPVPIVTAHVIKCITAACDEAAALLHGPDAAAVRPLMALLRWLACPVEQRFLRRRTHEAIELVSRARPPRRRVH